MTRDELRQLVDGTTTVDFATACKALGIGLTAARAAERRGDFPCRAIRVGSALRVPSVELERLLLTPAGDSDE